MATKNLKPISVKSANESFSKTNHMFGEKSVDAAAEHIYPCDSVFVPELNLTVKIRKGRTLKQWLIKYCINNPIKKSLVYDKYGISYEDELEYKEFKTIKSGKQKPKEGTAWN
ncbi:MAG: hypothetical protein KAH32_07915 [Chlamydiia bacterium]|nr:hypothetical protein [Chlamydiia bacterium]